MKNLFRREKCFRYLRRRFRILSVVNIQTNERSIVLDENKCLEKCRLVVIQSRSKFLVNNAERKFEGNCARLECSIGLNFFSSISLATLLSKISKNSDRFDQDEKKYPRRWNTYDSELVPQINPQH